MATLILGAVGRAAGGPVGGLIGSFVGGAIDSSVLGGKPRQVGRLANLAVQSSAYGEPIPRLYGTMRVAGNLIWTAGIAEHSAASGGGKGRAATTGYSYTASFAVLLSARPVGSIGRIWADGKLLRDATGAWIMPATMRVHTGGDGQAPDQLIVAAEAAGGTPAYRGLAYAVFEDLPLADYGNRIPNLTFEVVAGAADAGGVIADLAAAGRVRDIIAAAPAAVLGGFAAARAGSIRDQIGALAELYDLRFVDDAAMLRVTAGPGAGPVVAAADLGSHAAGDAPHEARSEVRGAAGQLDDAVAVGFYDAARDYQPGLQRAARRADARRIAQVDIAAALDAGAAKTLAASLLARRSAARVGATFRLPTRALGIRAGAAVTREGDATAWSARRWTFSNFVSELAVERRPVRLAAAAVADAGRVHDAGDTPAGLTTLQLLDLPGPFGDAADAPRLLIAAAGTAPGWRRSSIALSLDGGETYNTAGDIAAPSVIGALVSPLAAGSDDRWDRASRIDVQLLNPAMWLEARSETAVLAGANKVAIGDEIVQFAEASALGGGRFVLTGLLRGRRGTAAATHAAGESFVLLDAERLLAVDPGSDAIGRTLRLRAIGSGDAAAVPVSIAFTGNAARPLAPVFVRAAAASGADTVFTWVRRSRSGFAWPDGVDSPLAQGAESYLVELSRGGVMLRSMTVGDAAWRYAIADRAADGTGAGATVSLTVRQLGDLPGAPARQTFTLS